MHYMRRRFQKGKVILHPKAKGVTSEDVLDFPLLGLLAGASWVTQKVADSKKKYKDQAKNKHKKQNDVTMGLMVGIKRHVPFLQSLIRQAKGKERDALLRAANADQINAVSEMVLNVLTNDQFLVRPDLVARLRPHKKALRELKKKEKFSETTT